MPPGERWRSFWRRGWLERFPEIAAELEECLEGMELLHLSRSTEHPQADPAPSEFAGTGTRVTYTGNAGGRSHPSFRATGQFLWPGGPIALHVAEALEYAHQVGVVHRDIKPANLLIDQRANVWITDFGLAHLETGEGLTLTGDLVGTLRYMSPEQALAKRGVIDHRTDIYSLGATLYELLTLEPALGGGDRQELLRQIAFEEPRRPRHWNRAIPTDLETIVLKALAKNPEERYATAQELASDLRCFLEDKPIQARRPSLVNRLSKWARRHRSLVAASPVLLVMALVGLAVNNYKTRLAYEAEAQQRTLAEENFQQARRMLDFFTHGLASPAWLAPAAKVHGPGKKAMSLQFSRFGKGE